MDKNKENSSPQRRDIQTVSTIQADGSIVELLYDPEGMRTSLACFHEGKVTVAESIEGASGGKLIPVPARNNLIRHKALLLPEKPEPFTSHEHLVGDIQAYLRRYVDLSPEFERIATAYVLLSWVFDAFNELPYLRFRGDYGSGKTRALLVVGSLCYKPFFASGASTVSPIFHTLDTFGGTLIVDETDFRFSDEKAELVKIFNNGNVRGFPVLRSAVTPAQTFDPRAFTVFGPKIVAMRNSFEDQALESRFITEEMGKRALRSDIPINLPDTQEAEARHLRNQLLWYRFTMRDTVTLDPSCYDASLSPRLNQIMAPLFAVVSDDRLRKDIGKSAASMDEHLRAERGSTTEGQLLEVILALAEKEVRPTLPISAITNAFRDRFGEEYDRPITPRYIGYLLRNRLRLSTYKRHGNYVLPLTQKEHLIVLAERYGVSVSELPEQHPADADEAASSVF